MELVRFARGCTVRLTRNRVKSAGSPTPVEAHRRTEPNDKTYLREQAPTAGASTHVQASAKSAGSPTLVEAHRRTGPDDKAYLRAQAPTVGASTHVQASAAISSGRGVGAPGEVRDRVRVLLDS